MHLLKGLLFIILIPFAFVLFLVHFLIDSFCFYVGAILFDDPYHSPLESFVCKFIDFWSSLLFSNSDK